MYSFSLKTLVSAIALFLLVLSPHRGGAAPSVGLIDFNSYNGDFTVVSTTNAPGGPWRWDGALGTWSAYDTNDCGPLAFRSSRLMSPILTVAAGGVVTVTFRHRYSFEADTTRWDG